MLLVTKDVLQIKGVAERQMKKNKTITALCVSLLALSSSNSLVYAATTSASSASSQTKVATSSQATSSSSTSATSSQSGQAQSSQNASTSSQTVSVSGLSGNTLSSAALTQSFCVIPQQVYRIYTADDFINWVNGINGGWLDSTKDVYLENDIDLAGREVPMINNFGYSNGCYSFGTFHGNNHTIKNLSCRRSSSSVIQNNNGTFENVVFSLDIYGTDTGFIQNNSGDLKNVTFTGKISGSSIYFIKNNHHNISGLNVNGTINGSQPTLIYDNDNHYIYGTLNKGGQIKGADASLIFDDHGCNNLRWNDGFNVTDEIHSAEELNNFSKYISQGQTRIDASLQNDISMWGSFTPIGHTLGGRPTQWYQGTFDGHGHRIYNFNSFGDGASLIEKIGDDGKLTHLEISGSVEGKDAGFVSENHGTITDCAIDLDISGNRYNFCERANGITDNSCGGQIRNSFYIGSLTNTKCNLLYTGGGSVNDVYYYTPTPISGGRATRVSKSDVETGIVTEWLNGTRQGEKNDTSSWIWKQVVEDRVSNLVKCRPGFAGAGIITKAPVPNLSINDIGRTDKSLRVTKQFDTDKYGQVEYKLTDSHGNVIKEWQANSEFTGLTPDTEYTISVRYKGNDEYLESDKASVTVKTKKTAEPQVSVDNIYGSSDSFTIKDNPDTSYGNVSYEITDNQGKPIKNGQKQANGDFSGLDLEDGVIYQVHVSYDGNDDYASTEKVIKIMKAPTVTIASKNANSLKVADLANTDKYGQAEYALSPSGLTANATSSTIDGLDSTTSYTVYAKRAGKGDYPPSAIGQVTTKTGNANYVVYIPAVMKTNDQASYVSTDVDSFNLGTHDSLSLSIINSVKDGKVTLTRQNDPARKTAQTRIKLNGRPVNNGNADIKVVDWQNSNCDYTPAISFTDPWNDNPRTPFGDYNGQITFQLTYNKHKEGN